MKRTRHWLSRHALALWFCGIAVLGGLRWWAKVVREGGAPSTPDSWLWLAGSAACAVAGIWLLVRARRDRGAPRN